MSIFRLKNKTGSDSQQAWANNFTFPNGVAIDLIENESIGLSADDIIGCNGGRFLENIATLVRTGSWCVNDGDADLSKEDSLNLIKHGSTKIVKAKSMFSGRSYAAFESHNFMDTTKWTDGESKYVITPSSGKVLHLVNSKSIASLDCTINDVLYFRIFAGQTKVKENLYETVDSLMLGASAIHNSPQIGNPSGRGSMPLCHIMYNYVEPISLRSSLGMRLEIGFVNNTEPDKLALLKVRVEAVSESE